MAVALWIFIRTTDGHLQPYPMSKYFRFSQREEPLSGQVKDEALVEQGAVKLEEGPARWDPASGSPLDAPALERRLEGITEKPRGGVNGNVREALQQSVGRILVSVDGIVTLEAKPGRLLGVDGNCPPLEDREGQVLLEPLATGDRQGRLVTACVESRAANRSSPLPSLTSLLRAQASPSCTVRQGAKSKV
jgi:hypothetical protein